MLQSLYPIGLLLISNIFMTFAWYGHLKFKSTALWAVILVKLGACILRVHISGTRKQTGQQPFYCGATEGDSGSHISECLFHFLYPVPQGKVYCQLFFRIFMHFRRSILYVQKVTESIKNDR